MTSPVPQEIDRASEEDDADNCAFINCCPSCISECSDDCSDECNISCDKYGCSSFISDCFSMLQLGCVCFTVELFYCFGTVFTVLVSDICCDKEYGGKSRYFGRKLKAHTFYEETTDVLRERPETLHDVDLFDTSQNNLETYDGIVKTLSKDDWMQELRVLSRLNCKDHLNIILKYMNAQEDPVELKSDESYSCLDMAMYQSHHEIAHKLIEMKISDLILHKGKYDANCLHLAILQNKPDLVKSCIHNLTESERPKLLHAEAQDKLVFSLYGSTTVKARLPLNMAVLVGNEEIVDLLIQSGTELDKQDSEGYSVLHTIVLMSTVYEERAKAMYSLIMDRYMVEWWKKTLENMDEKLDDDAEMEAGYYLLNLKTTKHKMTCLVMAAQIGSKVMLDRIINTENVFKFTLMKGGSNGICYYDITDIDTARSRRSADDCPSVVEMLITTENDRSLECFDIPLLEDLMSSKWDSYFIHYVIIAIGYFLYMGFLTATMFEINLPEGNNHSTSSNRIVNSSVISPIHWTVFVGAVFILLIGVSSLVSSLLTLIKRKLLINIWRDATISLFCIVFSGAVICRFVLYVARNHLQVPLFGISVVCGWCFSIFFLNGFRPTALFSVMIERLLFRDLLIFAFCYFLISCGFAAAFVANMNYRTVPKSFWYSDFKFTLFTLFRTMVGATENNELFEDLPREVYGFNIFLFIIYVVLTTIFLLNMLIASMSSTYSLIAENRDLFWKKLRSHNIRLFERKMPICIQDLNSNVELSKLTGIRTKQKMDADYKIILKERKLRLYKIKINKQRS